MLQKEKISVVLCTYNGSKYIEKQLDSILKQSYKVHEIIIVDDCSNDSTREILQGYKNNYEEIKLFFNDKNSGPILSFKYALSLAENDYIVLCDQDDIWFENKVETQMNLVINSGFDNKIMPLLVFHDLTLIDQHENIINESFWKVHKFRPQTLTFKRLLSFNIVTGCTCLINKPMIDEIVKCDMIDILMHDHLIALIGYGFGNVIYIDKPLMYYRSHLESVTGKEKITLVNRFKSFIFQFNNENYLMPNIKQVNKFSKVYEDQLDNSVKKTIKSFSELEHKNILIKLISRFC